MNNDKNNLTLYPYQQKAVDWLIKRHSAILGDDVGLGKTVTTIKTIENLVKSYNLKNILIITPNSLKFWWEKEIERWSDFKPLIIMGSKQKRLKLWQEPNLIKIANYELVLTEDYNFMKNVFWDILVLDEITRIKSYRSKTSKLVLKLKSKFRYGLTGTPIENYPTELYNIFKFISPHIFGSWFNFKNQFCVTELKYFYGRSVEQVVRFKNFDLLKFKIAPFFLRRKRFDVLSELPSLTFEERTFNLNSRQEYLYNLVKKHMEHLISKQQSILGDFNLLRILCDTPKALVNSSSWIANYITPYETNTEKIEELKYIMEEIGQAKIVIFTEWVEVLKIIKSFLEGLGYKVSEFHGGLSIDERQRQESLFLDGPNQVMISTQAGGWGVNWQKANIMINFDSPFNPAKIYQRIGRVYRLGQFNKVLIIDFYTKNTIEERVREILEDKQEIINAVIGDGEIKNITLDETLIKKIVFS